MPTPKETATAIYAELLKASFVPSEKPNEFDTGKTSRLHRQFWMQGPEVADAALRFQRSDIEWRLLIHMAHLPQAGRNSISFGQFDIAEDIDALVEAWSKNPVIDRDAFDIETTSPEWVELPGGSGYFETEVALAYMTTRPFNV